MRRSNVNVRAADEEEPEISNWILAREDSSTSIDSVKAVPIDPADLPTFYTAIRLVPMSLLLAISYGMLGPVSTEFLKLRVLYCTIFVWLHNTTVHITCPVAFFL